MTRARLLLAALLPGLFAACASTPVAPAPPRGSRFVLVPLSVTLRQRPRDDAPGVLFRPGGTSLEVAAFRRVRVRGDWVLVEPPGRPERQCHPTLVLPPGMQLRFWVRASELAPVLVRTVTRRGADGSALRARPGLRVVRDGDLSRIALAPGTQAALALDPSEVGDAFSEPRPAAVGEPGERLVGDLNTPFLDGGQFMTTRGATPVYVTERRAVQGGHLAQVQTACADLTVRVQPQHVVPVVSVEMDERPDAPRPDVETATIRAGARLRWSDGAVAGAALADIEVGPEVRRIADQPCHSIPLSVRGVDGLRPVRVEVCAQPAPEAP